MTRITSQNLIGIVSTKFLIDRRQRLACVGSHYTEAVVTTALLGLTALLGRNTNPVVSNQSRNSLSARCSGTARDCQQLAYVYFEDEQAKLCRAWCAETVPIGPTSLRPVGNSA